MMAPRFWWLRELFCFILPLALSNIFNDVGEQFLNSGLARVPNPTVTLAAWGLGWNLVKIMSLALQPCKQLAMALVVDEPPAVRSAASSHSSGGKKRARCCACSSFWRVLLFVAVFSSVMSSLLFLLGVTDAGLRLIRDLHTITDDLARVTQLVILYASPLPIVDAMTYVAVCSVQCVDVCCVQCSVVSVQCSVFSAMCDVRCAMCAVSCELWAVVLICAVLCAADACGAVHVYECRIALRCMCSLHKPHV